MPLNTAFAAVLEAMRAGRGLTQRYFAGVSSRTYVSKLEHGQSSPTLEMITARSRALNVNPLTLVAVTLRTKSGQSVKALLRSSQDKLADLAQTRALKDFGMQPTTAVPMPRSTNLLTDKRLATTSQQTKFCFAE
nr:helix-turn-helix transcriptional regulator [Pseudomonas extremaustralis]